MLGNRHPTQTKRNLQLEWNLSNGESYIHWLFPEAPFKQQDMGGLTLYIPNFLEKK